ncbi:MAG: hypothetical protein V2J55_20025 [Candidatus Competibacteraceae bacterium]|jgi:hypothetical protein|nr:hypothetical protein [Candidatus Competibacteraceae bacterium]
MKPNTDRQPAPESEPGAKINAKDDLKSLLMHDRKDENQKISV